MLKIGVLGAGHLGKIHINCIKQIEDFQLVGFYDPDKTIADKVESEYGIKYFESLNALIDAVDVVDIVTPTIAHFDCAEEAIKKKKHIFIEKPITTTLEEAESLIKDSKQAGVKVQIGHVERFNPAFISVESFLNNPLFIETHRLAQFNPRGTDVPVVLDLMIHDIDILLSMVKSKVLNVSANGVNVISDTPDIANARIEFENGGVANLTASRISIKNMRKTRIFQRDAYISVDFLDKKSEVIRMDEIDENAILSPFDIVLKLDEGKKNKKIFFERPKIEPINAIKTELESFYNSIINDTIPIVSVDDGYNALALAYEIMNKIEAGAKLMNG